MGFYLSGHPLDAYDASLKRLGAVTIAQLMEDRRRSGFKAVLAGTMIKKHERRSRNDQSYAFVSFSDATGMFEVMLFPEVLAASRPLLEAGKSVLVTCSADWDGDDLKLRAASIADLDAAAAQAGEGLRIQSPRWDRSRRSSSSRARASSRLWLRAAVARRSRSRCRRNSWSPRRCATQSR
jgi:DNA polymerase-3 subunit alpha